MDPAPTDPPLQQLVFRGECLDGHDPRDVRLAMTRALKLDARRAERLFSGRRVVLKRGLDAVDAHRMVARFASIGALVQAEPSQPRRARSAPPDDTARRRRLRLRWRRGMRAVAIGVAGIAGGLLLGVVLGPWLARLGGDALPAPATQSARGGLVAQADALPVATAGTAVPLPGAPPPASPRAAPAQAAAAAGAEAGDDEDPLRDMPADVTREYSLRYLHEPNHKAFAVSSRGAFGWHAGAADTNTARAQALARCLAEIRPGDDGCRIVDADGEWSD